jgi:hypothetical protein
MVLGPAFDQNLVAHDLAIAHVGGSDEPTVLELDLLYDIDAALRFLLR